MNKRYLTLTLAVALLAAGCSSSPSSAPTTAAPTPEAATVTVAPETATEEVYVTETVTVEPAPEPEPEPEPVADPAGADDELFVIAMGMVWDDMTPDDQETLCWGMEVYGPEKAMEAFYVGLSDEFDVSDKAFVDWFNGVCGL